MYAVVQLQWHQYIVSEGQEIVVDKMSDDKGATVNVENVLAVFDEKGKVSLGQPNLKGKVVVEVKDHIREKKIRVTKFRRKNRYNRIKGFRAHKTVLTIKKIDVNG